MAKQTKTTANFIDQLHTISDKDAKAMAQKIADAFDERMTFEADNDDNLTYDKSMKPKLLTLRTKLANPTAARVLIATNTDPAFINRSVNEGKRHNIYALQKIADAVQLLCASEMPEKPNAINQAIIKSLFNLHKVGKALTFELAKACCSKNYRPKDENVHPTLKHLVRHTVSTATMSTQSSSSMSAMTTLGLVNAEGGRRDRKFTLREEAPAVKQLASLMQIG